MCQSVNAMTEDIPQLSQQLYVLHTNWKQCIVCQKCVSTKTVVLHPRIDSYQHLLEVIQERANLQDSQFVQIQRRLTDCTVETLQRERAVWHRTCYSDATNKAMVQ